MQVLNSVLEEVDLSRHVACKAIQRYMISLTLMEAASHGQLLAPVAVLPCHTIFHHHGDVDCPQDHYLFAVHYSHRKIECHVL